MGGFLFAGMVIALLAGLAAAFLEIPARGQAVSVVVAELSAGLILYRRILTGGETNHVLATAGLYVSVFNLVTSQLSLFGIGGDAALRATWFPIGVGLRPPRSVIAVAAMMALTDEPRASGACPAWNGCLAVEDVDDAEVQTQHLGGRMFVLPRDISGCRPLLGRVRPAGCGARAVQGHAFRRRGPAATASTRHAGPLRFA